MKKIITIILLILNLVLYLPAFAQDKTMILDGMIIAVDPGHGGKDKGTSYENIYEKDINLKIALYLKEELEKYGANILLTREGDYDLSKPNTNTRKKSDFDNRIKLIEDNNTDFFISIHQNYYKDSKYSGMQVFYKNTKELAKFIQEKINSDREVKEIDKSLYMYRNLQVKGLLIECGFLSNENDRKNLTDDSYQKSLARNIAQNIALYFKNK